MSKIVPEERARQGRRGTNVLVILVAALILAVVAWFIAEMYGSSIDNQPTQLPSASTGNTTPQSQPAQ